MGRDLKSVKRVFAVLSIVVSAHLLLFYLNFALRYSAVLGVEHAASEMKVSRDLALLFLVLTIGLQFLTAWLWRPAKLPTPNASGPSPLMQLPESSRPELWENLWILFAVSVLSTVVLFGLLFFITGRTSYLSILLKFCRLA